MNPATILVAVVEQWPEYFSHAVEVANSSAGNSDSIIPFTSFISACVHLAA